MTDTMNRDALAGVLPAYGTPPQDLVFKKGSADYVGHADITAILIKVDPGWTWEPQAWDPGGGPLVIERGGRLTMWGWMTVHGKTLPCVGTVESSKLDQAGQRQGSPEVDKELIGDLIRNGAMRFGIGLNLWTKADWAEPGDQEPARPSSPRFDPDIDFHAVEPEPVVWDEKRWDGLADRLLALPDIGRNVIVGKLINAGLFDKDRRPCTPFTSADLDAIERLIAADPFDGEAEAEDAARAADDMPASPPPAAIEIMAGALSIDDPLNPPDGYTVEPWMWDLAEVEDLDAHNWKTTATAAHIRQKDILDMAQGIATELSLPGPDRLDAIHGHLAVALRNALISSGEPF